jgi:hypothetical protein
MEQPRDVSPVLVNVVDEVRQVVGGDLLRLVEGRQLGLGGQPFALGFGELLGDELGVRSRFESGAMSLDLHVGLGDPSAGRFGSLVDPGIGGSAIEEVGEGGLDSLGVEELGEPAVDVADDLVPRRHSIRTVGRMAESPGRRVVGSHHPATASPRVGTHTGNPQRTPTGRTKWQ